MRSWARPGFMLEYLTVSHPESKSTPTFSDFRLLRGLLPRKIFKTGHHRLQNCANGSRHAYAGRCSYGPIMLNKVLVQIVFEIPEFGAPQHSWGLKKVPNFFFGADFRGFAGILRQ